MCEFIKNLEIKKFTNEFQEAFNHTSFRVFKPIRLDVDLWLSIQASYGHRCKPQENLDNLNDYTHWELALFNDDSFLTVSKVTPEFKSLAEIELYADDVIYSNVPVDLVEELFLDLERNYL